MQEEKYHCDHGRGRNVSCMTRQCKNYNKKISRSRGWFSHSTVCPICRGDGFEHSYYCTVGKNGIMECDCFLRYRPNEK